MSFDLPVFVLLVPAFAQAPAPKIAPGWSPDAPGAELNAHARSLVPFDWIARSEYRFTPVGLDAYSAPNDSHELRSRIDGHGIEIMPRETSSTGDGWKVQLHTHGFGRDGQVAEVENPAVSLHANRVELRHARFTEWYVNDERGIEQGWTIPSPPQGPGHAPLRIELAVYGLAARIDAGARSASFVDAHGRTRVRYRELFAWDASGRDLPVRLCASASGMALEIDVDGALYPITVDPLLTGPAWTAEANQQDAWFGFSVAGAGDVDGDGFGDAIVGAPYFAAGGAAFVFLGAPNGPSISPHWATGTDEIDAAFGRSVSGAGDVNGDGFDDVIVGAPFFGPLVQGRAYVYVGSPSGLDPTPIWSVQSANTGEWFGYSVAGAGDVNADGFDDVIVGGPRYHEAGSELAGRAYVFLGSPIGPSATPSWIAVSDGPQELGKSVSGAGDVDGDGFDDVIVGASSYIYQLSEEGRAYVYMGSAAGLASTAAWTAESNQGFAHFGTSVSRAGDVNGDGFDDVIVGAPHFDNGQDGEGRAYVFLGSPSGLTATASWIAESNQPGAAFGWSVSGAGDLNGDGFGEVIVGAWTFDGGQLDEGRAYVFAGSRDGPTATASWTAESDQHGADFGTSVSAAGDVNGDGFDDVIVGARRFANGEDDEGRAFVYLAEGAPFAAPFCFGDGSGISCPCGNAGAPGNGCANSVDPLGANLASIGVPSIAADSFVLHASAMPNSSALYFQGTSKVVAGIGSVFGDGLRCAGGAVIRLATQLNADGASQYPASGDMPISIKGANASGDARTYQVWYRNAASFCTSSTFNLTNGLAALWSP